MTRSELAQELSKQAKQYKGSTDGKWSGWGDRGQIGFSMDIAFPNVLQATMFAQWAIWTYQVQADVVDNVDSPAQVTIMQVISGK